jgi:hypothetical protein
MRGGSWFRDGRKEGRRMLRDEIINLPSASVSFA